MINREVRRDLLTKLLVSPQALSQRAQRIKDKYGPMTTEEATYIIAHIEGLDLAKYLPLGQLDKIRSLIPREIKSQPMATQIKSLNNKSAKQHKSTVSYPLVQSRFIQRAVMVGEEAFPQVVVLENSIRALIEKTLSVIRLDWWDSLVPLNIQKNVQRTLDKEKKYPYREKRGDNHLMYCNFADLKEIIVANNLEFQDVIVNVEWFKIKMDEVYMARNNLAHSILLSDDDISRIALFYRDWARLLEAVSIK